MKNSWFCPFGWFHRPAGWPGWLATALALVFCVQVFVAVDRHSHSASDTFYGVFPFWACAFLLWNWLAERTSHNPHTTHENTSR
jgi:hypothetical protein